MNNYIKAKATGGAAPVGATIMKTGCTVSTDTGDDGDIQEGRDVDFFTLPSNNPFGNTKRFTGITGGYYDEILTNYYDNTGILTTRGLAFPSDIFLDWSTFNGFKVIGYYFGSFPLDSYTNLISIFNSANYGNFSVWRCFNVKEAQNIQIFQFGSNFLNYEPILSSTLNASSVFWTSTSATATSQLRIQLGGQANSDIKPGVKTSVNTARGFAVRTFTVTGTTLT